MRFQLISDNTDTLVGMRLAGIAGTIARTESEVKKAILDAISVEDIAIVLITEGLVEKCKELVYELKTKCHKPLIVEIPDGGKSSIRKKDSITRYVRDAIGVKV